MTTFKQKLALEKTVENGGNVTKAMREAGYSEATANNPSNLTKSEGYQLLLKEYGLDEEFVTKALVEDIKAKPQNRARELLLASEILGLKKKGSTITIENEDQKGPAILFMPESLIRKYGLDKSI